MPALLDVADVASAVRVPDRPGRPSNVPAGRIPQRIAPWKLLKGSGLVFQHVPPKVLGSLLTASTQTRAEHMLKYKIRPPRTHQRVIPDPCKRRSDGRTVSRISGSVTRSVATLACGWRNRELRRAAVPTFRDSITACRDLDHRRQDRRPGPDVQITRGLDLVTSPSLPLGDGVSLAISSRSWTAGLAWRRNRIDGSCVWQAASAKRRSLSC